jgi:hypothetical protein
MLGKNPRARAGAKPGDRAPVSGKLCAFVIEKLMGGMLKNTGLLE